MFSLRISLRYLLSRKITVIAILGVAIGVTAMIVAHAVMSGFQQYIMERIRGGISSILITDTTGFGIEGYEAVMDRIAGIPNIKGCSARVERTVMMKTNNWYGQTRAVRVVGVDPAGESRVGRFDEYLQDADLTRFSPWGAIVGKEVMPQFLRRGDSITLTAMVNSSPDLPVPIHPSARWRNFEVVGMYQSNWYAMDYNVIFVPLRAAQKLLNLSRPGSVTAIAVGLHDETLLEETKHRIQRTLQHPTHLRVQTWKEAKRKSLSTTKLEKRMEMLGISLITLVAGFNIWAIMGMLVTLKTRDIGILRALGAGRGQILSVFLTAGFVMGFGGSCIGIATGTAIASHINEIEKFVGDLTGFHPFPQEVYYLEQGIPVDLSAANILLTVGAALIVSLVSSLSPALQAARLSPVEAIVHG